MKCEVLHLAAQRTWALEKSLRDALQRVLVANGEHPDPSVECAGSCEKCVAESSKRCVLFVGGRTALMPHYQTLAKLANRLGIRLMHHKGNLDDSHSDLPGLIHQVDAVVCPTDCMNAEYQQKRSPENLWKP